jgi:hypothetical protein
MQMEYKKRKVFNKKLILILMLFVINKVFLKMRIF